MSNKPDFNTLSRVEFRRYILANREDEEALAIYLERFQNPDNPVHPAPETIEDLESFPNLHQEEIERRHHA
jgi:hypothetical protein